MPNFAGAQKRAVILGGGFGGAYAAQSLCRKLDSTWEIVLTDRNNFLLFYPLLIEAGVGNIEPRHVVVPLRNFLKGHKGAEFRMGEVTSVDLRQQQVEYMPLGTEDAVHIHYDQLVLALGSITKMPPIPGLREHGYEMKSLIDGVNMRDRGIRLLELANSIEDKNLRRELLRVVVVGSNFTGIEFAGEYQDFMTDARRSYDNVHRDELGMMVLEYADRILPAIDEDLAEYAREHLAKRGLDIRTKTSITEVAKDHVILTDGKRVPTHTVVWCAGIAPNPMLAEIKDLPRDEKGYIECEQSLRVKGFENVWAIGDSAKVLDPSGKPYAATAQNATRQGQVVGSNIAYALRNQPLKDFSFNPVGSLAALGCRSAVAKVFGIKLSGFLAWWLYRTVYVMKMPSWSRRIRIVMDWTVDLFFAREPVQLGIRKLGAANKELLSLKDLPEPKEKVRN
jgi:NADH dehydrogenase